MFLSKLRSSLLESAKIDTAAAKLFPKGICEPARRKILDQAKFLSKGRFMGYWDKAPRSCINIDFNTFFRRNVADID